MMTKFFLLAILSLHLTCQISEAFTYTPALFRGLNVCKYKIKDRKKRAVSQRDQPGFLRSECNEERCEKGRKRFFNTLFGTDNYEYDCCPGWTHKLPLVGCLIQTCITLPQDTLLICSTPRAVNLNEQESFYRLTTPPETLKSYPNETTNLLEAVAFPLLNQTSKDVVTRSLTNPLLNEMKWVATYLGMSLRNKLILMKSLLPGNIRAYDNYSDYADLLEFYRNEQKNALFDIFPMEDVLRYPSQELPFKDITESEIWQEDDVFVQQRLAGLNPMALRLLTQEDLNKDYINRTYNWDAAIQRASGQINANFQQMFEQGLLYLVDYPLIHGLTNVRDIGDLKPWDNRKMVPSRSPFAVFASIEEFGLNALQPVAIQLDLTQDAPVLSPIDGSKWLLAKEEIQRADIVYTEIIEHLLKTHLLMEPICVCMRRTMPAFHPLHQIFKWHCRGLFVTNSLGLPALLNPKEFLHTLFAIGHTGTVELLNKGYALLSWEDTEFEKNLEKRGVKDPEKLPYFPYRDDGLVIWNEIGEFAKEYVNLYYEDVDSVLGDTELQNFANELSADGIGLNGGIGMFKDFPAKIETIEELIDIVKRIVFIPIQHHAVNYPVAYYGGYVPNMPTKLYNDPRVPTGEFNVHTLPQAHLASYQVSLSMSLGSLRYDKIFDYGDTLRDDRGKDVINKYHDILMGSANDTISARNDNRLSQGMLSYPYLLPPWMPNSIHT